MANNDRIIVIYASINSARLYFMVFESESERTTARWELQELCQCHKVTGYQGRI
jgi:hypothetical protein